jgi:hypothetical protein
VKILGIVLIVVTGLLTFHPPHFLLEAGRHPSTAGSGVLEIGLAVHLLGCLVAAVGVARTASWGWLLGIMLAGAAIVLYLTQQTIGLPGLPHNWTEPSRLVALAVQAAFIAVAVRQLARARLREPRS